MSPATEVRLSTGLSLDDAAKKAGITAGYLRQIERLGGCSYRLGQRLARIYGCSANVFLMKGRSNRQEKRIAR